MTDQKLVLVYKELCTPIGVKMTILGMFVKMDLYKKILTQA